MMSETGRLISCPDCGSSMSRRAIACVKCGAPNERLENDHQEIEAKANEQISVWEFIGIMVIFFVFVVPILSSC